MTVEVFQREQSRPATIAYFSMEVGLEPEMPTYSGGLGVLAGDTLRAAADLGVPLVGVTLLHRKGYFRQKLDSTGRQTELPAEWRPDAFLEAMPQRASVTLEGRRIVLRAWRLAIRGVYGHTVTVYLLDSFLPDNSPWDQALTDHLYAGDDHLRLCQEAVLGLGGVAMLRALGLRDVRAYHMNEGHSAFLALALLEEQTEGRSVAGATAVDREEVRKRCVFTTHTPVPAGHDLFAMDMVRRVLGHDRTVALENAKCCPNGFLNMTYLALSLSRYINGVAMSHSEISRTMFPHYPINSVTNGVHGVTWTSEPFQRLFDSHFPEWRRDNNYLRYAIDIEIEEIRRAHEWAKRNLLAEVERRAGVRLDPGLFTAGFARRATAYKRADLIFSDLDALRSVAQKAGGFQVIYAGKAHPKDEGGKAVIKRIYEYAASLKGVIDVIYLEEYDIALAKLLCSGVDLWLNTPQKPMEASGTSGMKAALNGVPSLSVLDGWWIEGHLEGVTGWSIEDGLKGESDIAKEAQSLYRKLGDIILPLFYRQSDEYAKVMRSAIAINGSFFNAQRMMFQYLRNAYLAGDGIYSPPGVAAPVL